MLNLVYVFVEVKFIICYWYLLLITYNKLYLFIKFIYRYNRLNIYYFY